jgi:RNA-binding protein
MPLTDHQKKHLRRLGHPLHPIVQLGKLGLTASVIAEFGRALHDHELVKVRARVGDRAARDAAFAALAQASSSELVFRIGNVGLFYKKNNKLKSILLPDS